MQRPSRITESFPRRRRHRDRDRDRDKGCGTPRARDPPPARPVPDPTLLEMLRSFDLAWEYGPCTGITRLQRWERAQALGLSPPATVREALLEHRDHPDITYSLWHEYPL
ncbi:DNA polymerase delta subunit 4 isoform X2 [Cuculus canorus]|uniref:DNA polymerase delta subunit 4 isoform X2 n=1 Tax=Cuculus canorus TaxID=55661 RepID=UPI0023AA3920|nr:DNA polymerase delta subunit 4 isoform X2 [Cuculus canorus]